MVLTAGKWSALGRLVQYNVYLHLNRLHLIHFRTQQTLKIQDIFQLVGSVSTTEVYENVVLINRITYEQMLL